MRARLAVDQVQPAEPKIWIPTKIAGIAINTSTCPRSRVMRRRSLFAAVIGPARPDGIGAASAQGAPASSQPRMPARRATATASSSAAAATRQSRPSAASATAV